MKEESIGREHRKTPFLNIEAGFFYGKRRV
jgi:hypothetical protein